MVWSLLSAARLVSMQLDKTASHRLRTLLACAKNPGEYTKVGDLKEGPALTDAHMNKIVGGLVALGLVETKQGIHGGVRLAPGVADKPLGHIIARLLGGELTLAPQRGVKSASVRALNAALAEGFEALLAQLNKHTIADVTPSKTRLRK
jgi:DNA-binding IscR family transcriptional regulator